MTTNYDSGRKTTLIKIEIEGKQDLAQILASVGRDEEFSKLLGDWDEIQPRVIFWLKSVSNVIQN